MQGSFVITALEAASHDTDTWDHPERFAPERFLNEKGVLCLQKDHSMPFGAGKRLCAGETFARNMLFLLTAGLLQNFNIAKPDNGTIPRLEENATGLIKTTPDFWVKMVPR